MRDTAIGHLKESSNAYRDLARSLPGEALDQKL